MVDPRRRTRPWPLHPRILLCRSFSRSGLDLKSRELATIAALAARGTAAEELPLKVHIAGAHKGNRGNPPHVSPCRLQSRSNDNGVSEVFSER
ncbi:carboxymuconolactone decarboxylase family protein [Ensifer sp. 4252]|uniref:carboxymuconolactone decarboxylase family protein n=1 Tax=Ensifer sp. 4252 TaxID=3373915 RepID=UPI003D230D15